MRRLLPWALVLALPVASAAGFSLSAGRVAEAVGAPGGQAVFEIPFEAEQDGMVYAKVLPTPGNAVDDGSRSNGSVAQGTGWRVAFALARGDGAVEELGTFANGNMSRLAPIRTGEHLTLRATVLIPPSALEGGREQTVYAALAYRLGAAGEDPGSSSGAQMDAARALTFVVHLTGDAVALPPTVPGGDATRPGDGGSDVPPVTAIDTTNGGEGATTRVIVQEASLPTWFLVAFLALLGGLVLVGALIAYALLGLLRDRKRAPATFHRVPVKAENPPTAAAPEGRLRGP